MKRKPKLKSFEKLKKISGNGVQAAVWLPSSRGILISTSYPSSIALVRFNAARANNDERTNRLMSRGMVITIITISNRLLYFITLSIEFFCFVSEKLAWSMRLDSMSFALHVDGVMWRSSNSAVRSMSLDSTGTRLAVTFQRSSSSKTKSTSTLQFDGIDDSEIVALCGVAVDDAKLVPLGASTISFLFDL